jgi:RNase P subunit RPR2
MITGITIELSVPFCQCQLVDESVVVSINNGQTISVTCKQCGAEISLPLGKLKARVVIDHPDQKTP